MIFIIAKEILAWYLEVATGTLTAVLSSSLCVHLHTQH